MVMPSAFHWKRLSNSDRPAERQGLPFISPIPGRIGNGGLRLGLTFSMLKDIGNRTGFFCLLGIISLLPFGQAIMRLKRWAVKSFRAECSIQRLEFLRFRNFGPPP